MQTNKQVVFFDALYFLKSLTFRKLRNILAIYASYILSSLIKKPVLWGKPFTVSIEPTAHCNLNCPECPAGKNTLQRPKQNIPLQLYQQIMDEIYPYTAWLQLFFQGEPFLHPHFGKIISYAYQKGVFSVVSTNGHYLTPQNSEKIIDAGLNRLIISLDGADKNTYNQYRKNGDFDKVIKGIETLVQIKKQKKSRKPFIILQFLVFRYNEHQITDIKKLGKKLAVNKTEIKSAQIYDYWEKPGLIPATSRYSRYKNTGNTITLRKKPTTRCSRLWFTTVIANNGDVLPCCFDKNGTYKMGNASRKNIYSIWKDKPYHQFRKNVLKDRRIYPICQNCTE